ncbi:extracellular solute-binding protein [Nonomuraea sp. NBC_00507]|uniref:extracellular solute-binding protein n=1 Tax=Nonomuraea sp. NBC_00507 TaxID=2976002 RepID=UPI002E184CD5
MKKRIVATAILGSVALLLSACSSAEGEKAGGTTTISFSHWGNNEEAATLKSMVAAFKKGNPDVDVQINWVQSDYEQKLQTTIAGGKQPTVAQISNNTLPGFAAAFAKQDVDSSAYYTDTFVKSMTVAGEVKATPFVAKPKVMAVNAALFKAAGVDLPSADTPMSVVDFIALAKKLTSGTGKSKKFGSGPLYYPNWLITNGGGVYNAAGDKCTLDSPIAATAADTMIAARAADGFTPTPADADGQDMFEWLATGRLAMQPDFGPWDIPKLVALKDPDIKLVRVPGAGQPMEVTGLGISSKATGAEKTAATAFVKFMSTSTDAQSLLTTAKASLGVPVINGALDSFKQVAPDLNLAAFTEAVKVGVVEPGTVKDPQIRTAMLEALNNDTALGAGKQDPAKVLAAFNQTCQSMLGQG